MTDVKWKKPMVIAEVGCNHLGDMNVAHEMIKVAASFCKVDVVKFQKRCNKELLSEEEYNAPHPNPCNSYGETYGAHREYLELNVKQHKQLKKWCEEEGVIYSTSVWDMTSAKEITSLKPELIKIPSACNTNFPMLTYLLKKYSGKIHLSMGMTTREEEKQIIDLFEEYSRLHDLILYTTTSGYPVPFKDVALLEITRLLNAYGTGLLESDYVGGIGYSGHHNGISVDMGAYVLGAEYIERHFTLDRTQKGTDHSASLEPDGMRRLTRDLLALQKSIQYKEKEILDIEVPQRKKLKHWVK